jgi:hypothetical protein
MAAPEFGLEHVTVIGELELPDVGVQLGAVAWEPPIVYAAKTRLLGIMDGVLAGRLAALPAIA